MIDIKSDHHLSIFSLSFPELSGKDKLKMELIEGIRHANDLKTKTKLIKEAADKLEKSTRTIRRMVSKVEQEGLGALASTVRSDKGQFRISLEWQEKIIKLYKNKRRVSNKKNKDKKLEVNRLQIYKLIEAEAKLSGLKDGEFPSHATVYKVLEPFLNKKKLRHPGQGLKQFIQTTDGQLEITHSNQIFQIDHTDSDILLVDVDGNEIGRPFLTSVIESNSGCIVGFHISFKKPGSHEVTLALRHAFLPKEYGEKYELKKTWNVSGIPRYFVTDRAKEFRSNHLKQIASQLGIELRLRAYPQQGGLVERPFGTINTEFLESIPGYTGSNIQKRPQNAEQEAYFTLDEFERMIVRFIVDNYNQNHYPRAKNQTRVSRWESMLLEPLEEIYERKLDICLLKSKQRKLQRKGHIQFENEIYKGECLRYCQSEYITVRYDPSNILRLMAYTKEEPGQPARYLGIIQARDRIEPFSIWKQKAKNKRINRESKQLDRTSIYSERLDRNQAVENKKKQSKAENRKNEQERIDSDRKGLNILEFKVPVQDENRTGMAKKKKQLPVKQITLKARLNKPKAKLAKVKASKPQRENLISIPLKVLYVRTSQPGGDTHLFIDILNALKRPLNSGTLRDLRQRVRGTLKKYQVKLLIVDDAHILKRNAMVELIKIHDDLKIPVVTAGAYDLEERLSRSKGYEHINSAFFSVHNYRTLTQDEVASFVMAWEEEVLMSWGDKDKPNLANDEEIIEFLYTRSSGLVQHLHGYLKKIAIAQLEYMANSSLDEGIDIYEVIGNTRLAKVNF